LIGRGREAVGLDHHHALVEAGAAEAVVVAQAAGDVHVERAEPVDLGEREIEEAVAPGEAVELLGGGAGKDLVEARVRVRRRRAGRGPGGAARAKEQGEGNKADRAKRQHGNVQHPKTLLELIFTFKFKRQCGSLKCPGVSLAWGERRPGPWKRRASGAVLREA